MNTDIMISESSNLDAIKKRRAKTHSSYDESIKPFKNLLTELEIYYAKVIQENIRLRSRVEYLEQKLTIDERGKNEADIYPHSFTKKMGALFDGASHKFKISRKKNLKTEGLVDSEQKIFAHADCVLDINARSSFITSSSVDHTCKIWSLGLDSCFVTYRGHSSAVNSCRLSPADDLYACSASGDGSVHVWSIKFALELGTRVDVDSNTKPDISTEEWIERDDLDIGPDKLIYLNKPIFELKFHQGPVSVADWTFDGKNLLSSSWDKSIAMWDVEKAKILTSFTGHEEEVLFVSSHTSQKLFVSASADTTVRLWDTRTNKTPTITMYCGHGAEVNSALFFGSNIISGSSDKTCKTWELRNTREPLFSLKTSSAITRMSANSEGRICLPMRNSHFRVWCFNSKAICSPYRKRKGHKRSIESSSWHETSKTTHLYTCDIGGNIMKWRLQN